MSKTALLTASWLAVLGFSPDLSVALSGQPVEQPFVYRQWQTHTKREGLPHDTIRTIRVSGDKVWVGTDGGLALQEGGAWKRWTESDGLPWPVITAIDVNPHTGDVWLGTGGGGLIRFTGGRFDQFTQFNSGLAGDLIFAVAVEGDHVWAATTGGVSSLNTIRDTWELHLARRADKPQNPIISLDLSPSQEVLFAAEWCGHLHKFVHEQGHWTLLAATDQPEPPHGSKGLPIGPPATLAAVAADWFWEATQSGLTRRKDGETWGFRKLPVETSSRLFVNCLAARTEKEAWLGTNQGLYVLVDWDTDTWVAYRSCDKESDRLATVIRGGQCLGRYPPASTIPADWVSCVVFQGDDVWVGTTRGIAHGIGQGRWAGLRSAEITDQSAASAPRQPKREAAPAPPQVDLDPGQPDAVTIAVFGPINKTIALPTADPGRTSPSPSPDTLAVQLAVEQVNAIGGYRGQVPFALLFGTSGYTRYGWGNSEDDLAIFANKPVVGVVASSGPEGRMTRAAALRTEVPVVNVADHQATIDECANPWIFRCRGDDPNELRQAIDYIVGHLGHRRLTLVRTPGADEQRYQDLWSRYAGERNRNGGGLVAEVSYTPGSDDLDRVLSTVRESGADAVLTWADWQVSAAILRHMREAGMRQLFVGSDRIVCDEFIKLAGHDPGAVIAPYPCPHRKNRQAEARFAESYLAQNTTARLKGLPPREAYLAYHATSHLLLAINLAGPDRHSIRNMLETLGNPVPAVLENGEWKPVKLAAPACHR